MQAPDTHVHTIQIGLRALAEIKQSGTSAEPTSYEVWYEHVRGSHRQLSTELKSRLANGQIGDDDIGDLYARFLSPIRLSDQCTKVGSETQAELGRLLDSVRTALMGVGTFDAELDQVTRRLGDGNVDAATLGRLIAEVVSATQRVGEANRSLEAKLRKSEESIGSLQGTLRKVRDEAMTDRLTSLYNRRALDERLDAAVAQAAQDGSPLAVLMIDIDHFKSFNDTHGHLVGDQVIRLVASCIRQGLAETDVAARFGGEEFAVLAPGRSPKAAVEMAEAIRRKIDGYDIVQLGTKRSLGRVSVSIGVTGLTAEDTPASILGRADECLYRAKRAGRNVTIAG